MSGPGPVVPPAATATPTPSSATTIGLAIAGAGVAAAEIALPVLVPFDPLIQLVLTAVRAHFNATGTLPTDAQLIAAVKPAEQVLADTWAQWIPQGK